MANRTYKGQSLIQDVADYTVVDIETTGLSPRSDSIIEISALRVRNNTIDEVFSSLINPGYEIPTFISDLTGITNDMLKSAPTINTVLPSFLEFLGEDIIVGHNVNFDINFLYDNSTELLSKPLSNDFIDTMRIARKLFPDAPHHRLQDVSAMLFVDYSGAHRAEQDCRITYQCYIQMIEMAKSTFGSIDALYSSVHKSKERCNIDSSTMLTDDVYFVSKTVCLSGNFKFGTKADISKILTDYGAIMTTSVNKHLDYLIVGENGSEKWAFGDYGTKINHALELKAKGCPIEIYRESDILQETDSIDTKELDIIQGHAVAACNIERYPQELFNIINNYNNNQKYGFSVLFNSTLIVRFNAIEYSVVVNKKYNKMVLEYHGENIKEVKSPQYSIKATFTSQIDVVKFIEKIIVQFVDDYSPTERFGCCHRYVECSDAGKCTAPDLFHAKGCFYRDNLEKGKIFYGKNAN